MKTPEEEALESLSKATVSVPMAFPHANFKTQRLVAVPVEFLMSNGSFHNLLGPLEFLEGFEFGDRIVAEGDDSYFEGVYLLSFKKPTWKHPKTGETKGEGRVLCVVMNDLGTCLLKSPKQIKKIQEEPQEDSCECRNWDTYDDKYYRCTSCGKMWDREV